MIFVVSHDVVLGSRDQAPNTRCVPLSDPIYVSAIANFVPRHPATIGTARFDLHRKALAQRATAGKYASYHPLHPNHPGYLFRRSAEPPLSVHAMHDHCNYQCNRNFKAEKAAIVAAYAAAATMIYAINVS